MAHGSSHAFGAVHIAVRAGPVGLALTPDGKTAFVANQRSGTGIDD